MLNQAAEAYKASHATLNSAWHWKLHIEHLHSYGLQDKTSTSYITGLAP